jgi:signal transduction histidine kinase
VRDRFNLLTLTFRDPALERRYVSDTSEGSLRLMQIGLGSSIVVWLLGMAAFFQTPWPGAMRVVEWIAKLIVPLLVVALISTRWLRSMTWQQIVGGSTNLLAGVMAVWATTVEGVPNGYAVPAFMLVAVYAYFLLGLRPLTATTNMVACGGFAIFVESTKLELSEVVFQSFMLGSFGVMTGVAAWLLEAARRNVYFEKLALERTQAQLAQSEKVAALGKLVAGVAHDINTPLGAIVSTQQTMETALEKLQKTLDDKHPDAAGERRIAGSLRVLGDATTTIAAGGERIDTVVRRLRSFARLDQAPLQDLDVSTCVDDVFAMVSHRVPDRVILDREVGDIPLLRCYPVDVNQMLLNVINNAIDAVGNEGTVTVSVTARHDVIEIVVQDDGEGIAADVLPQIFDPGFTTKGVGVGAGLGLSIALLIAEKHDGTIEAETANGQQGARFSIRLPIAGPATAGA